MTIERYDVMLKAQGGKCVICGGVNPDGKNCQSIMTMIQEKLEDCFAVGVTRLLGSTKNTAYSLNDT